MTPGLLIKKLILWPKTLIIIMTGLVWSELFITTPTMLAQEPYYFHTINSHGLSLGAGRTTRLTYLYQLKHNRQLKLSGTYIYDSYDQGRNHIKNNIYNVNAQFQYHLINKNRLFLNYAVGLGGYHLAAKDLLNIKHREWKFTFVAGFQAEYYIARNRFAITLDYDFLLMPWSRIYNFLHVPTVGVIMFFF